MKDGDQQPAVEGATRRWSAAAIAITISAVVGSLALVVNLVLIRLEPPGSSLLRYDLTADVLLAAIAGLVLYDLLRREALTRRRTAELQQREDAAQRERARAEAADAERKRLLQIMDTIPQGVCIIREDFEMDYVNPVLQRTFGLPEGRKCHEYLWGAAQPCAGCPNEEIFSGHVVRRECGTTAGRTYELIDTLMPARGGMRHKLELLSDITEAVGARKRNEELMDQVALQALEAKAARADAEEHADELAALLDISRALTSTLETRPLLERILSELKDIVDYSNAFLAMVEDSGVVVVAYQDPDAEPAVLGRRVPLANAVGLRTVLRTRKPLIIPDLAGPDPWALEMAAAADPMIWGTVKGCGAWMGVPLMVQDRVVGFLRLAHETPSFYTDRHAELALAIANQAAIALDNARLYGEAQKVARLEERQRMAGELHDSVSQALYGIALGAHAAREQLEQAPERLRDTLDYVLSLSESAVTEMRSLVFELHPESLEQLGMVLLLTKLVEAARARDNLTVRLDLCAEPDLELQAKEMLYRIAQEALRNVAKHAVAANVEVCMWVDAESVELVVADDGVGFDTRIQYPGHYGLISMRERATRLGGTLDIESEPGRGVRITARVPLLQNAPS